MSNEVVVANVEPTSRNLTGEAEKSKDRCDPGEPVSWPTFQPDISFCCS